MEIINSFGICVMIICILRVIYGMILKGNKMKKCRVKIYVEYEENGDIEQMKRVMNYLQDRYLQNADIVYKNIDT